MSSVKATLAIDRETKNTFRYAETEDSMAAGAIGTIYLSRYVATRVLGNGDGQRPEKISVTVERAGRGLKDADEPLRVRRNGARERPVRPGHYIRRTHDTHVG